MRAKAFVNQPMAYCARERVPVTVESASVPPRNGTFQGNFVNVMTETATNMMGSFAQAMVYVAVETVNAGKDGMGMLVKSGLGQNTLNQNMEHQGLWGLVWFFRLLEQLNAKQTT
ncbi:hypothetical protein KIL84_019826 [Mauremys mutica]|uniref:Uncharacterized protein n=1 Tax=Mauremys mutica TaxID=74926 RepID=A0A9D4B3N8_9SAUR|nr:hypothetical protein KIL84_019826 [Mauremys mutica]